MQPWESLGHPKRKLWCKNTCRGVLGNVLVPLLCSILKSVALAQILWWVPEVLQMEAVGYFTLCNSTACSFLAIWQHFSVPEYRSNQVTSIGTELCALEEELHEWNLLFWVNKLYKRNRVKHHLAGIVKVVIKWSEIFEMRLTLAPFFLILNVRPVRSLTEIIWLEGMANRSPQAEAPWHASKDWKEAVWLIFNEWRAVSYIM